MDPVTASINPFPQDVRAAFQVYIEDPAYVNRECIEYSNWRQLYIFLDDPELKPATQAELR
jgi:hypothetical protein